MIALPEIQQPNEPILMLNMLKFKDRDVYFKQYAPAFDKVIEQLDIKGAKLVLLSNVLANVVADADEQWDAIVLVEYPSAEAFKTMAESKAYQDLAEPYRVAALQDWKLYMTRKSQL
jgi:uncharacterized protein (DUF1330 family)